MRKTFTYKKITIFFITVILAIACIGFSNSFKTSIFLVANSGIPIANGIVTAFGANGHGLALTNSNGEYSINEGLKSGYYSLSVIAEGYLNGRIENIQVTGSQTTQNINFYLYRSGGIAGKVTDFISGLPLKNVIVAAINSSGNVVWQAITDTEGKYNIITNLVTGIYNVTTILPEGYVTKSVSGITVTAGYLVQSVNLALERSGIISGRITAVSNGAPLENIMVYAISNDAKYYGFANTNATGYYKISSGLGTSTYMVVASSGLVFAQVPGINVVAGAETTGVNMTIAITPPTPSGMISGKITDNNNIPIIGADVIAQGPSGYGQAETDTNGNYLISKGLGTGLYTVNASAIGYSPKNVTDLSVIVNQMTSNINFKLSVIPIGISGTISGTVQGELNAIPEYPNPILMFIALTLSSIIIIKILKLGQIDLKNF